MVNYQYSIHDRMEKITSHSSLPMELNIPAGLNRDMAPPEMKSRYTFKPLPPLPPPNAKSSNPFLGHEKSSSSLDVTAARKFSNFPVTKPAHEGRGSTKDIEDVFGHKVNRITRWPTLEEPVRHSRLGPPQLPEVMHPSKLGKHDSVDAFSDVRQYMRSDSNGSLSSASAYSEENTVEEIVDIYSKWGSWAPWAPNSESLKSPEKRSLYLQPSVYSLSATELGYSNCKLDTRRPSRASLDTSQISPKAMTLAELITAERERFGGNTPRNNGLFALGDGNSSSQGHSSTETNAHRYPPWNKNEGRRPEAIHKPLALTLKGPPEPHRSISRWSDHSSDEGIISNARDSVISHIRSMSSPFKVPSRPSVVFKEKTASKLIQISQPEQATHTREFSSGKHPLKSPFPIRSPLHKKIHPHDSPGSKRSNFARRISDSFKKFPGTRHRPMTNSQIISNHARSSDGPDTPMPTMPGFVGMISPTAVFFQKRTLHLQDALRKAKHAARVRSRDERRRDKLRKKITIVRAADMPPVVSQWV